MKRTPSPASALAAKFPRQQTPTRVSPGPSTPLRRVREAVNLPLDGAARGLDMTPTRLRRLELGASPNLDDARRLARFYGVSIDRLWPEGK